MLEFWGETRARVVLIGGGGAVTGTVSVALQLGLVRVLRLAASCAPLRREHLRFSFCPHLPNSRIARETRDKKRTLFLYFFGDSAEISRLNYRSLKNRPTLPERQPRMSRTCSRIRGYLLVILS